ncbi:MAG TPA: penicillin-binding protein 2 [Mycobacteriales bacterium]|nr:penicillin-binding protein 2 [Mycobacteriales bacterium]
MVVALLAAIGLRLLQLQGVDGAQLAKKAQDQRLRQYAVPAMRGEILDRAGNVLAYSVDVRDIVADPTLVRDPAATAHALASLVGVPEAELRAQLDRKNTRNVTLARGLTPAQASQVAHAGLVGVFSQAGSRRLYPARTLAANVIGFAGRDGTGLAGIEQMFNAELAGRDGELVAEGGSGGQLIPGTVHSQSPAVPGSSVQLTLDQDLQYVTQSALDGAVAGSGARGGQAAVLNARTGEVLALAVSPAYDAQAAQDGTVTRGTPLANPAVSSVFEPGSVNKMVTFAAALEAGLISPSTVLEVPGSIKVADRVVHDAWSHGLVRYTATGVVAKSSNVGTLMIAQQLGPRTFYDYLRKFGLGAKSGVELPGESAGLLPPLDRWSGSTFGNLPIGQGVGMTILQMAGMYQAVANDGLRVQPRIVRSVTAPDGTRTPTAAPAAVQVISPRTAATLRYLLEAVVEAKGGTAPSAAIDGYRVAGKTGTGQQPDPTCGCYSDSSYWATFAGMAPADNPRLVVAIMIDSPRGGLHGGAVAAPTFRKIMAYALKQRAIPPTGSPVPTFRLLG